MKKNKKILKWSLSLIATVYLLVLLFPQVVFANKFEYKNFTIYHHDDDFDEVAVKSVLDMSISLLEASELYNEEIRQRIFLSNSFKEFTFFAPRSRKAFAINYPLTQHVFLSSSNFKENSIKRNADRYNTRTLSGVIAHETTHSLLENELGTITYKMLPSWKNEGYCDYIARESSYKTTNEKKVICSDDNDNNSLSFAYFKYRILIQDLFENQSITVKEFLNISYDLEKTKNQYCNH